MSIIGHSKPELIKAKSDVYFDPIGHLASTGNWFKSMKEDMDRIKMQSILRGQINT